MSRDDATREIVEHLKALIAAVEFDDSGVNGRGGNGGLLSPETRQVADRARLSVDAWDRWWKDAPDPKRPPPAPVDFDDH